MTELSIEQKEIQARLRNIERREKELDERQEKLDAQAEHIQATTESLNSTLAQREEDAQSLSAKIKQLEAHEQITRERLEAARRELEAEQQKIDAIKAKGHQQTMTFEERIEAKQEQLQDLDKAVDRARSGLQVMEARRVEVEKSIELSTTALKERVAQLEKEIAGLEEDKDALLSRNKKFGVTHDTLVSEIDKLESREALLNERIAMTEAEFKRRQEDVERSIEQATIDLSKVLQQKGEFEQNLAVQVHNLDIQREALAKKEKELDGKAKVIARKERELAEAQQVLESTKAMYGGL